MRLRRTFLKSLLAGVAIAVTPKLRVTAAVKEAMTTINAAPKKPLTPRDASLRLLQLANQIEASNWDREVKNDIAARVEEISALILTKTKTPALCGTDTECANLERTIQ